LETILRRQRLAGMPYLFIYAIVVGLAVLITLLVLLFFYPIAV